MIIVIYILFAVLILLGLYFAVPYAARNILRACFIAKTQKSGCICLTFDDGPNPESTPEILLLLKELGIKATFFQLGRNVEKYPDLVRDIIEQGHEIGDHGYSHVHSWACVPFCALRDLLRGNATLKKHAGSDQTFWLRPPYGKLNLITLCYVLCSGRKLAFWNVDPKDYLAQPPEKLAAQVLKKTAGGSVILLHEVSLHTNKALEGNLLAIKIIVRELHNRGCSFATVSEAAGKYGEKQKRDLRNTG